MPPTPSFMFGPYKVRPVGEHDRPFLAQLIAADEYHRNRMTPDYFLERRPREEGWALENREGRVVLYFKLSTVIRLAVQFGAEERRENRAAMIAGTDWIEGMLRASGFGELVFDTEGPELKRFAERRLGFAEASVLSRTLYPMPKPPQMPPTSLGSLPSGVGERVG